MAVVGVAQRARGYPKGKWGEQQSFTDGFLVRTDDYDDGPIVVLQYGVGLPLIGQMYSTGNESHPWALMREYTRVERIAPRSLVWMVECEFQSVNAQEAETVSETGESSSPSGESQAQNPLLEIPEIDMDYEVQQEPITSILGDDNLPLDPTAAGNLQYGFTSSAGELLDPQPTKDASRQKLTISRNEPIYANHAVVALAYQDAVNSDNFWDAEPGQVRLHGGIKVKRMTKMLPSGLQIVYLRATYTFLFKYPDWDLRPLDNGSYYKTSLTDAKKITFKTSDGQPFRGLLDGSGNKLTEGQPPHYLGPYKVYRRVPFSALLLPNNFRGV